MVRKLNQNSELFIIFYIVCDCIINTDVKHTQNDLPYPNTCLSKMN